MTGTSWDVLRPLAEAEMRFYHRRTFYPQWTLPRECIRYTLPVHSDRYRLHFFHTLEDLSSLIAEQPRAKWMIFVDSKARGRRFAQELSVPTTYLDAESKGSDVWEHIIREKEFSTQVLVTTSALDVGIDIIDPEVQNVAVIADNRTALLQMAGRRRLQAGERIDLWVCDLPKAAVSARLRKYQDWLHWYSRLDACRRPEHHWALAAQLWCQEDPALRVLFRLGKERIFPDGPALGMRSAAGASCWSASRGARLPFGGKRRCGWAWIPMPLALWLPCIAFTQSMAVRPWTLYCRASCGS